MEEFVFLLYKLLLFQCQQKTCCSATTTTTKNILIFALLEIYERYIPARPGSILSPVTVKLNGRSFSHGDLATKSKSSCYVCYHWNQLLRWRWGNGVQHWKYPPWCPQNMSPNVQNVLKCHWGRPYRGEIMMLSPLWTRYLNFTADISFNLCLALMC